MHYEDKRATLVIHRLTENFAFNYFCITHNSAGVKTRTFKVTLANDTGKDAERDFQEASQML